MPLYAIAIGLSENQKIRHPYAEKLVFPIKMLVQNIQGDTKTYVRPIGHYGLGYYIERFIYAKNNTPKGNGFI